MDGNKRSLEQWVELIRDQEMPIFGHTVQAIVSVAADDAAPAAQLASVVLKDASMTTRVLQLANSIYYNPQRTPINSVVGKHPFLVVSITINDKGIGLLFADRALSGRGIDEESRESFSHFAKQANLGLSLLASRRK